MIDFVLNLLAGLTLLAALGFAALAFWAATPAERAGVAKFLLFAATFVGIALAVYWATGRLFGG